MNNDPIHIDDAGLRELLDRLVQRLSDLTPVMRQFSELMIEASQRAFDDRRNAWDDLTPWRELAPATQKRKIKTGRSVEDILQQSGLLVSSIGQPATHGVLKVGPFEALVGTNVPYAAAHQFGAKIKRGSGSITLPARPFLGVDDADIASMCKKLAKALADSAT